MRCYIPFARHLRFLLPAALLYFPFSAGAQGGPDWNARLVGKPLYLRAPVIEDDLEFDSAGHLKTNATPAPFTLSGVEITAVDQRKDTLLLHGIRVALISTPDSGGLLARRRISSTTRIFGSLRRGDKRNFHAEEEMRIIVHPDESGNYEAALGRIFAVGEGALAGVVPPYWQCYAQVYLRTGALPADPEAEVQHCVTTDASGAEIHAVDGPNAPRLLSRLVPQFPQRNADLHPAGTVEVHLVVLQNGSPVGFQVVHAVGGGIDEALLMALAQARFAPGTRDGQPVAAALDLKFTFQTQP